MHSEGDSLFLV